jgi:hypothetical protein
VEHFATADDARRFITAGNAVVTLESKATKKWYTYKVTAVPDRDNQWWVKVLSGPDNTADYVYLGMINGVGFKLTKASKFPASSIPVRGFNYLWRHLEAGELPDDMEVHHEGRCGRCNRVLTTPESITRGIGPECAGKMGL